MSKFTDSLEKDSANKLITIRGARVNNLKNISLEIPRGQFIVVTGVSGSGKSSLAFDTLFAEGQRRFAESLSSYARQFLGRMSKPDVDFIDGIPPAIAIEQKVTIRNPRSTVATTTEVYDFLRLVFARIGRTFSPVSGREVRRESENDVLDYILEGEGSTVYILSDIGWDSRDDKVELMLSLKEKGYSRLYGSDPYRIEEMMQRAQAGDYPAGLKLLHDRARTGPDSRNDADTLTRLRSSIADAFEMGDGVMEVEKDGQRRVFSKRFELDGISFIQPDDYLFSFNSPLGACPVCGGLGKTTGISEDLVIPDKSKSIYDGAIAPWRGDKMGWFREQLIRVSERYGIPIFEPWAKLSKDVRDKIWKGVPGPTEEESLIGIEEFFRWVESNRYKVQYKYMLSRFSGRATCSECGGSRLRKEALWVKVCGRNIHELLEMTVDELYEFFTTAPLSERERKIVEEPLKEIIFRLSCIRDVGLGYLTLSRNCNTLSGGENQRINLVTALGSSLTGSMYILDEPSIGLHPRDTERLIAVLRRLRDLGNTVLVVEHDEEIIKAADILIDLGPRAGSNGGQLMFMGKATTDPTPEDIEKSLTLQYITGARPRLSREKRKSNYSITLKGAMEHNLKDIDVRFPLDVLTVVTGVSGSGKSSLVGDILYPALRRRLTETGDLPGTFKGLSGNLDRIDRIEYVDQNPIGKSSRSNAATYLKIYDDIRKLLADQQYAKINGFTPSFFSFNQEGGRCPECQGEGVVRIPMQFMSDVTMVCEECGGKRFKGDILEVRYNGKNVDDILNMSVEQAIAFFSSCPESEAAAVVRKLQHLADVGLGYILLGQSSSTFSGGESQRIKLAYFLAMSERGGLNSRERIMFIFDEPTTGLHFFDVEKLLKAFDALLERGHSLVVVEHNPDVIRAADWVIDLGPEAGENGGRIVFEGTPEELVHCKESFTAKYIAPWTP